MARDEAMSAGVFAPAMAPGRFVAALLAATEEAGSSFDVVRRRRKTSPMTTTDCSRPILFSAAVAGFFAVAIGAFGAHAIRDHLDAYRMGVYQTGVQYHFWHALALALTGLVYASRPSRALRVAAWAFGGGLVVFCGSLYLLALTGTKAWGAVTPLGGIAFLVGWLALARGLMRK